MRAKLSIRTWVVIALGVLLAGGTFLGITLSSDDAVKIAISDIVETVIGYLAAAFIIWAAVSVGVREPIGRQWLLIGGGVLVFAVGDTIWTWYEVVQKVDEVPFPGWPDVFYLLQYPLLGAGVILAALAYRRLVSVRWPMLISAALAIVLAVPVWLVVVAPIVSDTEVDGLYKAITVAYPFGDLIFLIAPVVFIIATILKLRGGSLARPWWSVGSGLLLMGVADTIFIQMDWQGTYQSGMAVDYGWMAGLALIALGASLMHDIQKPAPVPATAASADGSRNEAPAA